MLEFIEGLGVLFEVLEGIIDVGEIASVVFEGFSYRGDTQSTQRLAEAMQTAVDCDWLPAFSGQPDEWVRPCERVGH